MRRSLACVCGMLLSAAVAQAQTIPGFIVDVCSTEVTRPASVTVAPDGTVFVGSDEEPGWVWKLDADCVATHVNNDALRDPDPVAVDVLGLVSGTAGAVITGGYTGGGCTDGEIFAIFADGTHTSLWGVSSDFSNPSDMIFDSAGRLLFVDACRPYVYCSTAGETPFHLCSLPANASNITLDDGENIYVACQDGVVRVYSPSGALLDDNYASGFHGSDVPTPMAYGVGPYFADGALYAINNDTGDLLRIDGSGSVVQVGNGFGDYHLIDMAFDANSGVMYLSGTNYSVTPREYRVFRILPDCNANEIPDGEELEGNDCNLNGIPDDCDLAGDIDGDGCVDFDDLNLLLANYGRCVY